MTVISSYSSSIAVLEVRPPSLVVREDNGTVILCAVILSRGTNSNFFIAVAHTPEDQGKSMFLSRYNTFKWYISCNQ